MKQVDVNVDYILGLIKEYIKDSKNQETLKNIIKTVNGSYALRNKKELIEDFIDRVSNANTITEEWNKHIEENMHNELDTIIKEENLKKKETKKFIDDAIENKVFKEQKFLKILPSMSIFGEENATEKYFETENRVREKLKGHYDKYVDIYNV